MIRNEFRRVNFLFKYSFSSSEKIRVAREARGIANIMYYGYKMTSSEKEYGPEFIKNLRRSDEIEEC